MSISTAERDLAVQAYLMIHAIRDLESGAKDLNQALATQFQGKALTEASKNVVRQYAASMTGGGASSTTAIMADTQYARGGTGFDAILREFEANSRTAAGDNVQLVGLLGQRLVSLEDNQRYYTIGIDVTGLPTNAAALSGEPKKQAAAVYMLHQLSSLERNLPYMDQYFGAAASGNAPFAGGGLGTSAISKSIGYRIQKLKEGAGGNPRVSNPLGTTPPYDSDTIYVYWPTRLASDIDAEVFVGSPYDAVAADAFDAEPADLSKAAEPLAPVPVDAATAAYLADADAPAPALDDFEAPDGFY